MSAVSKKLIPASRAAPTTRAVSSASSGRPKLLHPRPTSVTCSEPMGRVSILAVAAGVVPRPGGKAEGVKRKAKARSGRRKGRRRRRQQEPVLFTCRLPPAVYRLPAELLRSPGRGRRRRHAAHVDRARAVLPVVLRDE